jgi:hypothetical protein
MFKQLRLGATLVAAIALLVTGCGATADRAEPGSAASDDPCPASGSWFRTPLVVGMTPPPVRPPR